MTMCIFKTELLWHTMRANVFECTMPDMPVIPP